MTHPTDKELDALAKRAGDAPLDDKDNCFICYEAAIAITTLRTHIDNLTHEWDEWRTRAMDRCEEAEKWFRKYGAEQQRADNLADLHSAKEYPRVVDNNIYQYDEGVFVWFDETGGVGGASNYLEEARAQMKRYADGMNSLKLYTPYAQ